MGNDRIHAAIDGEVRRESLTEAERARLAEMEATLDAAATALRAAPVPDLASRVLAGLPASAAPPAPAPPPSPPLPARVAAWLWRPLTIRFRPALAVAGLAAAMLAGVLVVPRRHLAPAPPAVAAARAGAGAPLYVQFRLSAPGASHVAVAGSFTHWKPEYELSEVAPGLWSVMVPLSPGVYDYTFVIDGQRMVVDPYAPQVADSYGGSNSRLFLPAPGGRA